jgi:hypothetical protein
MRLRIIAVPHDANAHNADAPGHPFLGRSRPKFSWGGAGAGGNPFHERCVPTHGMPIGYVVTMLTRSATPSAGDLDPVSAASCLLYAC